MVLLLIPGVKPKLVAAKVTMGKMPRRTRKRIRIHVLNVNSRAIGPKIARGTNKKNPPVLKLKTRRIESQLYEKRPRSKI